MAKLSTAAAYVFCVGAAIFLGRFELHTDDTGVLVGLLFLSTFALGFFQPRHAWRWALLVGSAIPAADLLFGTAGLRLLPIAGFVIAIGLAGSYSGVLVRKLLQSAVGSSL